MTEEKLDFSVSCPIPITEYPEVMLAHGGGGTLMRSLIEKIFFGAFGEQSAENCHDSSVFSVSDGRLAFTTDSFVVSPLFFPGGDIGKLAVCGTVNDLAMSGARPKYLSAAFVLEEGFSLQELWAIAQSMRAAADEAGVKIVTGDTKVVDRGKGDGVFITTAGIGVLEHKLDIGPQEVRTGDVILINGDLGRHGMTIMCAREGLDFHTSLESDCAPLWSQVEALLDAGIELRCLRDLTRGGLVSALCEIAEAAKRDITIDERSIPIVGEVSSACEILGLDPLYVANEGRFLAVVPAEQAERALTTLQPQARGAALIGTVEAEGSGMLSMRSVIGTHRVLDMISGEQLPRIC